MDNGQFLNSSSIVHYPLSIHCQNSTFYDAAITPNTNMIRATTEAMAAVIGGCDSLTIHGFEEVFSPKKNDEFSERIARNISVLMQEEAHLDKTFDASAGSYFIENLTNDLANSAWANSAVVRKRGQPCSLTIRRRKTPFAPKCGIFWPPPCPLASATKSTTACISARPT